MLPVTRSHLRGPLSTRAHWALHSGRGQLSFAAGQDRALQNEEIWGRPQPITNRKWWASRIISHSSRGTILRFALPRAPISDSNNRLINETYAGLYRNKQKLYWIKIYGETKELENRNAEIRGELCLRSRMGRGVCYVQGEAECPPSPFCLSPPLRNPLWLIHNSVMCIYIQRSLSQGPPTWGSKALQMMEKYLSFWTSIFMFCVVCGSSLYFSTF